MIKIGIIGCGLMGGIHAGCFKALEDLGVRVTAVANHHIEAAEKLAGADYEPIAVLGSRGSAAFCLLCRATVEAQGTAPYYLLMELNGGEGNPKLRALNEIRLDPD